MKIWPARPAWLIDVEDRYVVPGQCDGDFVALSYRWGEQSGFRVNADNMTKLQELKALDNPEISEYLVPILQDAMYLTSIVGERYLWMDALCVVQGDDVAVAEQLNLMGAIYANAIVTIVAADGDSQEGILGLRNSSNSRKLDQHVIPFGKEKMIVKNKYSIRNGFSARSPYSDRGWTFQEERMSQRRIVFNERQVHWVCQCNVWHEETVFGAELKELTESSLSVILAGFPDTKALEDVLSAYNSRHLCYDEDTLPGISGLFSIMSRTFRGGFLCGLPEMQFDRALGWRPTYYHEQLRRRTLSDRPNSSRLSDYPLPSWLWVGWQAAFVSNEDEVIRINSMWKFIDETFPITEWYTSNSPHGSPLRRIRSTWYERLDTLKGTTKPLPEGWTRDKRAGFDNDRDICDKAGRKIGKLYLHNAEQRELFPKPVAEDADMSRLELVAIYRLKRHKPKKDGRYKYSYGQTAEEFYVVLWIEWVEDVAYRLASGSVQKVDWEGADLEDVSLVLG
ncbi:uncharacterized protein KY384_001234 [Bacidia gigantensis]|uniref:uncharacterized protein n=1 Tax=Bacidia gigantensis TaxID=2732470 RepID=UPI001D046D76|nr:uncharacterized protein KY384_001234 [Bacidia gigantensis]KAG8534389.1 hypothetical protein KY384_001234 [Bacidia gigantensis]